MNEFSYPEARRVLVLSPHPDDESLGCSGTILLYTEKGLDVYLVVISNGEKLEVGPPNIGEIRRSEAVAASEFLEIKKIIFLGIPDEGITTHKEEIKSKLSEIIKEINPDLIFSPFPLDPHPDHRATSEVALSLMRELQGFKLAFYEIYHPIRFNVLVDISSVIHKKKEAIFSYQKSLLDMPEMFWHSVEGLDVYRSLLVRKKSFYEAFWLIDTPVSYDEVIKWATFDYANTPAQIFLSKLKGADQLIYELQNAYISLEGKDREISSLEQTVKETERRLSEKETENQGLKTENYRLKSELNFITDSFFWKFIKKVYVLRDKLFPDGTMRRDFYNKAIKRIKG